MRATSWARADPGQRAVLRRRAVRPRTGRRGPTTKARSRSRSDNTAPDHARNPTTDLTDNPTDNCPHPPTTCWHSRRSPRTQSHGREPGIPLCTPCAGPGRRKRDRKRERDGAGGAVRGRGTGARPW
ncbi:hypothetical protein SAM23877_7617 [Streptomyces ambofaciens ATCC 23877]|uniref:Uncharacterized protein n=1 Tax=Streptomyces ambofaciens (strain ATCC 23877 / 3486 / DSM 40053 / JCM 4204 / NBRC 12836 / NRRL B-2516) TaxID=278992 RepID=A0A0K2AJT0_STRA7|nr:hypothetical protein SAM23877_0053 [Streptomyces ambofaciens ATCC 23877]AKZ60658.1 hypothetical protein SAM23877_7617 [Streptomyces ambofaciens ATCC 23877]